MSLFSRDIAEGQRDINQSKDNRIIATAESHSSLHAIKEFRVNSVDEAKNLGRRLAEKSYPSGETTDI